MTTICRDENSRGSRLCIAATRRHRSGDRTGDPSIECLDHALKVELLARRQSTGGEASSKIRRLGEAPDTFTQIFQRSNDKAVLIMDDIVDLGAMDV